ncbi:hypothetical protein DCS_00167 [Drechmeria coniospora]|uniref:N-acetyltransferase domain-containing protein n=1 Tax=Drechmeria coniospora TaxID=98403 RepID=A0A151GPM2_DRECN|nr:hypothetical protein DCS_00167 [Drechmeria coniospora]KYK59040.1 hypothetical protein DCS_00167 [Drechmeria coniospora]
MAPGFTRPRGAAADDDDDRVRIDLIQDAGDVVRAFDCVCAAFGRQTNDGIWVQMNPAWDTLQGRQRAADVMVDRWRSTTRDNEGRLNSIFLKATVPSQVGPPGSDGHAATSRDIVGIAIWQQASVVPGHGDKPPEHLAEVVNLEALHPGNEAEQRYACQLDASLRRRRIEVVKEKATAAPPAAMVLDLCAVDPAFQGRGIATKLVRWGLDEAQRRGGIEAITEASAMGRRVYQKLGFRQEGPEVRYDVDAEFADRKRPSNIFMRTSSSLDE